MDFLPKDYDLEIAWKKVVGPFEHPDFVTHANYLNFMSENTKELQLMCRLNINKRIILNKRANQKIKLIELTLENLTEEKRNIDKFPDYSIVCVSWVSVKSYYLIFNLLILIEYLITSDNRYFTITHTGLHDNFKNLLNTKQVIFNKDIFNNIYVAKDVGEWKIPPWENVKRIGVDSELRYKQIMKILVRYSRDEFKRINKINRLSGNKLVQFQNTTISIFEFFYWYRIKANYRDMEFVDKGVEVSDFVDFYNDYFNLSMNFYSAMKKCINNLAVKRIGKTLLN